jgi:aminomethyltransferase
MKRTPLYEYHAANGKLVEFAGYEMPIWYTSITEEHLAVRTRAGIFDVSHMGRVLIRGLDAGRFVDFLVPTASAAQAVGKSFYTLLLNEKGGIIDDLIVIKRGEQDYLVVVNAANRATDLEHIRALSVDYDVAVDDITESSTMIAVQGPEAARALQPLTTLDLPSVKRFTHVSSRVGQSAATVTRTGYTGEDGFEIILYDSGVTNSAIASSVWSELAKIAKPCGLGARDSLRIEAGLPLYGSDIDQTTDPFQAELSWVISKDKQNYVGSNSVSLLMKSPRTRIRRGMILNEGIPRKGFEITDGQRRVGEVTSGTFSPILRKGIAIGYLDPTTSALGQTVKVNVRSLQAEAKVVKPPFYDETLYGWKRAPAKTI